MSRALYTAGSCYLILCAVIDWRTMYVYRLPNYLFMALGAASLLFQILSGNPAIHSGSIPILGIYTLIVWLQVKKRHYGAGDGYLYTVCGSLLAAIVPTARLPEILLYYTLSANLCFFLYYGARRLLLKEQTKAYPFVPSMAIAWLLLWGVLG